MEEKNKTTCLNNCGNCIHSSLEIINKDFIMCDKNKTLENFNSIKDCYE